MSYCLSCQAETKNPFFCSNSCAAKVNNVKRAASKLVEVRTCAQCSKRLAKGQPKFCSKACGWESKKRYTSEEERYRAVRARMNEANARYNAKKKNQTPSWADLPAIKEFYLKCPKGFEVDHVVPISKGGLHTLENLQYLTKSENRKKGAKII